MRAKFYTLDVFTDQPLGGNPLAVFPDGDHVPEELMQKIAREMNLSETVFVTTAGLSPGSTCRARIFTPAAELPFAGHPSVGTAFLLALIGKIPSRGQVDRVVLEEGVGPVPVMVRRGDGDRTPQFAWLAVKGPEQGPPPPDAAVLAEVVSLAPEDLLGAQHWTAGVPFVFVQVRDRAAIGRARIDPAAWERHLRGAWSPHVYLFTGDAEAPADVRSRMFAPAMGIVEDPATGGAAAAFAGLLAARDARGDGTLRWTIEQGVEMGRPSRLQLEADVSGGAVTEVRVGGSCVLMSEGSFYLPDPPGGLPDEVRPSAAAVSASAPAPPPFAGLTPRST